MIPSSPGLGVWLQLHLEVPRGLAGLTYCYIPIAAFLFCSWIHSPGWSAAPAPMWGSERGTSWSGRNKELGMAVAEGIHWKYDPQVTWHNENKFPFNRLYNHSPGLKEWNAYSINPNSAKVGTKPWSISTAGSKVQSRTWSTRDFWYQSVWHPQTLDVWTQRHPTGP